MASQESDNSLIAKNRDIIENLVSQGFSDTEISSQLCLLHPGARGLSDTSIKRFRIKCLGLKRRAPLSDDHVDEAVAGAIADLGDTRGRRYLKGYMDQAQLCVSDKRVAQSLRRVAPASVERRRVATARRTNPIPYKANYFGHHIHFDQNEKLVNFGVTHVAAIDGYSGFVVGHATMPVKNPIAIYDLIYRPNLHQHGMWDQVVVDCGSEFVLVNSVHESLRQFRTNTQAVPVRQISSTKNNRIERFWVEVNDGINYPIKAALEDLVNRGLASLADPTDRYCISAVACQVAAVGMTRLVDARNHHHIEGLAYWKQRGNKCQYFFCEPYEGIPAKRRRTSRGAVSEDFLAGIERLEGVSERISNHELRMLTLIDSVDALKTLEATLHNRQCFTESPATDALRDYFKCVICQEVPQTNVVVLCGQCFGVVICTQCRDGMSTRDPCPQCRGPARYLRESGVFQNMLRAIRGPGADGHGDQQDLAVAVVPVGGVEAEVEPDAAAAAEPEGGGGGLVRLQLHHRGAWGNRDRTETARPGALERTARLCLSQVMVRRGRLEGLSTRGMVGYLPTLATRRPTDPSQKITEVKQLWCT